MTSWQLEVGWETADRVEKGIGGSGDRKSRDLEGKTADRQEKGIAGLGDRKSRDLEGKTAGSESKVQIRHGGGGGIRQRRRHVGNKK